MIRSNWICRRISANYAFDYTHFVVSVIWADASKSDSNYQSVGYICICATCPKVLTGNIEGVPQQRILPFKINNNNDTINRMGNNKSNT